MSGGALRGLAAFFCSLWDFTLYIGVATAALGLATGVIIVKSPINALFCLIGVFISSILLLLSIRVEFLSMILLIVYIGAIAILFLFVIMLLNLKDPQKANFSWNLRTALLTIFFAGLSLKGYNVLITGIYVNAYYNNAAFVDLIGTGQQALDQADYYLRYGLNDIALFSDLLYTSHAPLFLLSSLVLLTAMIGAIVLAMSTIEAKLIEKVAFQELNTLKNYSFFFAPVLLLAAMCIKSDLPFDIPAFDTVPPFQDLPPVESPVESLVEPSMKPYFNRSRDYSGGVLPEHLIPASEILKYGAEQAYQNALANSFEYPVPLPADHQYWYDWLKAYLDEDVPPSDDDWEDEVLVWGAELNKEIWNVTMPVFFLCFYLYLATFRKRG